MVSEGYCGGIGFKLRVASQRMYIVDKKVGIKEIEMDSSALNNNLRVKLIEHQHSGLRDV